MFNRTNPVTTAAWAGLHGIAAIASTVAVVKRVCVLYEGEAGLPCGPGQGARVWERGAGRLDLSLICGAQQNCGVPGPRSTVFLPNQKKLHQIAVATDATSLRLQGQHDSSY